ncbi:MAG: LLM class flavin-dependent oxidoreductase [Actinomycetota bacterium]|nr:LLM class flavin-dependent oxidoreductase [Actinomycetota bacterium]
MNVGIGLPNSIPGVSPATIRAWAERADSGPFSSVGVVDRLNYPCHEPMTTLASVAPLTSRVRLATTVIIGPLRRTSVLAEQAATVHSVSGGRLVLGLAVGARSDDYAIAGVPTSDRGERLSAQLVGLRSTWDDRIGETTPAEAGPPLIVGGMSDRAFARAAHHADGYVHGGGPPRSFARAAERFRVAWEDAGRPGEPQLWAQGYFALGDGDTTEQGRNYMLDYYGFTGPFAKRIAEGLLVTPQAVTQFLRGYSEAGCGEVVLFPAVAGVEQVKRLAEVVADVG